MTQAKRQRCAVYTRVSTDEGLSQAYTSIDAQRDAGESYIESRRSEGWVQVGDYYDDGGFSGGTLERPAMQRLLADIKHGKVDIIVAYKLDRLSRSLFDFAELVKLFDTHSVTFVSVTQHFNTTDAMGRMLLNILLTFAQFERELTSERIRDKFIASKRKGFWMHGIPPLGYDVEDRRLVINEEEAKRVRWAFRRFIETRSIQKVAEDARKLGHNNKVWVSKQGRKTGGMVLGKSAIHKILHTRTYLGLLQHRDIDFENTHPPIIDVDVWREAHLILSDNSVGRGNMTRASVPFLLKGLVFAPNGRALIPWHTTKSNGRLYRYYQTRETMERGRLSESPLPRLPAAELEDIVLQQLRSIFKRQDLLQEVVAAAIAKDPSLDEARVTVATRQIDRIWDSLFPEEQSQLVRQLIERVVVKPDAIEIRLLALGDVPVVQELSKEDA
ncbi:MULTISPECIES: recombinase family protein [unclassified Lysobacter]|uniref:recombinase family protein n=1 Tax=unclassified Lysobacter TaxID=2635362 RepID=UPI001BECD3D9|nr:MULTISPECIES: recombinase family protein [unclassified Lysobacter]MBT2746205.1 recombinase family protein [Lysobacter sp. ISL-42]MBT2750750.1 recombinase family protein [Lysobacter sp. ISL-50]MBT2776103.1 recombinase family protein [Lysobacter sp. ISL-54]MBT2784609.1 recombinase family protein [Lysobacter sp. ISL-52]